MINTFDQDEILDAQFTPEILEQLDRAGVKPGDSFVDADGVTRTRPAAPAQEVNLQQNYQQLLDSGLQPGDHFRDADGKVRRVPNAEDLEKGIGAFKPDEQSLKNQQILARARQATPEFTGAMGMPRPSPITERTGVTREQSEAVQQELAAARAASIQRALGEEPFDAAESFAQLFTNPRDFATLYDMARSIDFESMEQKFKSRFPDGDITTVAMSATPRRLGFQPEQAVGWFTRFTERMALPAHSPITERTGQAVPQQPRLVGNFDTTLVARRSPDEPYREIGFGPELAAAFVSEQALLGGIAIAGTSKFTGGAAVLTGVGVGLGGALQRAIEKSRGYEQNVTTPTALSYSGMEGVFAGLGDAGVRKFLRSLGISTSLTNVQDVLAAQERLMARAAARDVSLEPLAVGHVGSPLQRGIYGQVKGTSPRPEAKEARAGAKLYDFFVANIDAIPPNGLGDHTLGQTSRHFSNQIRSIRNIRDVDTVETGRLIQEGERLYNQNMTELTNRAYKHLADVEQAAFAADGIGITIDISGAVASAQRYRAGMQARGRPVQRETDIVDPSGQPLRTTEIPDVDLPRGYHRDLEEVVNVLLELDPSMQMHTSTSGASLAVSREGITSRAVEQTAQVRTRLFEIMQNRNNRYDNDVVAQATDLWNELTQALDNPIGAMGPEVSAAHQIARSLHREKEEVLTQTEVLRYLSNASKAPEDIVKRYSVVGRPTALRSLKDLLERSDEAARRAGETVEISSWDAARQGIVAEIIRKDGAKAYRQLNRYANEDPTSLRLLMTESEEDAIRRFLIQKSNIENLNLDNVMLRFASEADRGAAILAENTPSQLQRIVNTFDGGLEGASAAALRGAVWRDIFKESTTTHRIAGDQYLDASKLMGRINYWKKTEKLDVIFDSSDLAMLNDLNSYAQALSNAADVGGPMQAGAIRGGLTQSMFHFGKGVGAIQKVFGNELFAYIYSRPAVRARYEPISDVMETRFRQFALYLALAAQSEFEQTPNLLVDPELEGQE